MAPNYETALPVSATTHLEVDVATPKLEFLDKLGMIVRIREKEQGEGCSGNGITVAELANVDCQTLSIAVFLIVPSGVNIESWIRHAKRWCSPEAPVLPPSQARTYGGVSSHGCFIPHLKLITVEAHESKASHIQFTTKPDDVVPDGVR